MVEGNVKGVFYASHCLRVIAGILACKGFQGSNIQMLINFEIAEITGTRT
jgi:hypothetical protein